MADVLPVFSEFLNGAVSSPITVTIPPPVSGLQKRKIISLDEVSWHYNRNDCWVIIYDRVYNITEFLDEHPGGGDILLEYGGREASGAFRGSGHSAEAIKLLEKYCIGELPVQERIFRKKGGLLLSDMPE